jgi:tryptophan 2,3-dioxygenase
MAEGELTYGSYLRIPELLALQQPRSRPPHPEELHFIVVHQALELWMKLTLHDLERIITLLDSDAFPRVLALLGRVNRTLEHGYLGTASGSQSVQFRELELLSGLRDPAYLKALEVEYGAQLPAPLAGRLAQRSLAEAHTAAAARLGIVEVAAWAELYVDPGRWTDFYLVCEALVDYDERWTRWRQEHVALVQRAIGDHARGTGGMAISYLQRTTRYRFFPVLWALRDELVVRGGGELVGNPRGQYSPGGAGGPEDRGQADGA